MKSLGIKYQILLLTLIPVFLIDLFFTYTHVTGSLEQENELLRSKSEIIARQIAGASEYNLFSGNDSQIQYLLEQTAGSDDIVLAAVYDREGHIRRVQTFGWLIAGCFFVLFTILDARELRQSPRHKPKGQPQKETGGPLQHQELPPGNRPCIGQDRC